MSELSYADVIIVANDHEFTALMPSVPRVGDLVAIPGGGTIPVASVEWQPKSTYAPFEGAKWRVIVTLDV